MTTQDIQHILKNIPLKKSPVTSQYISVPAVEIKKREFPNYQKKGLSENIIANYHFICLLGREVVGFRVVFHAFLGVMRHFWGIIVVMRHV